MSEINHGPLPDGGFWAGFCSNPDCNVLGCPGDCQPQPVAPAPDAATVLAELVELWDDEDASLPVVTNETWASEGERLGRRGRELKASARALVAQQATSGAMSAGGAVRVTDGVVALHRPDPVRNPWHCYNTYDGSFIECRTDQDVAGYHVLPAAPPTPSASGMDALLAECVRRQAGTGEYAFISCDQIVRLLAPSGADGEREGT